jgi:folate-binding protein YgfZ
MGTNQEAWRQFIASKASEKTLEPNKGTPNSWLSELSSWDLVQVEGDEAASFLQGQLSCDVDNANEQNAVTGACINLKGRIIGNFLLVRLAENSYILCCPKGSGANIIAVLKKYGVFSKVNIDYENKGLSLAVGLGLNEGANDQGTRKVYFAETTPSLSLYLYPFESMEKQWSSQSKQGIAFDHTLFESFCISQGIVFISEPLAEKFTPQEINFDLIDGINFSKGCYTGQEVVARLHYRGTPKRRMYIAVLEGLIDDAINQELIGSDIVDENGKEQGQIVLSNFNQNQALASLSIKAFEAFSKQTKLQLRDTEITISELQMVPYPLDP